MGILAAAGERLRLHEAPRLLVPAGKERVALVGAAHAREIEAIGTGQRLGVDLGAADHEELLVGAEERRGFVERMHDAAAGDFDPLARDDHVGAVGQRPAERLVGLAAHDHGVARGEAPETPQVFGNVPEKAVVSADDAIFGHGDDDADHKFVCFGCVNVRRAVRTTWAP